MSNQFTEEEIQKAINYLMTNDTKNATRAKAIDLLLSMQSTAHIMAHKIVEDEEKDKIKPNDPED